ncbi:arsenate reductase [Shewanella yunxiaonensis]|uniref:Arsenate reductase n=1 Tax=Shewanella yunxiaonensis TaxID=2829809 RepID=A0ABX7YY64_9GAMM|nr:MULTISPECIES: arsenate reductase [Shewanella]MDF0534406.1 arsenate reductase [Shewanella sp. A32]QUN07403.1 arsenate reductase [Shewanella yunxiaonensis]
MTSTLYGISPKICDTVKKAVTWLDANHQQVKFFDYREQPLPEATIDSWIAAIGWEALLNKRSTSFRALSELDKQDLTAAKAKQLMLANTTLIKRPVLQQGDKVMAGFNEVAYREWFGL